MKLYLHLPLTIAMAAALSVTPALAQSEKSRPSASKPAPPKKAPRKNARAKVQTPTARINTQPATPYTVLPRQTITGSSTPGMDEWLAPGDHRFTIEHDGLTRSYMVHVPERYQPTETMPLLVALNSPGSPRLGGEGFASLRRESDYQGFIAVYPEAYGARGQAPAWSTGNKGGRQVNDVGFIAKVVHNVFRQASVDRGRIYAAGFAEGGTMAYQLACDLPHVFRGVASVGGADTSSQCAKGRAVTVFHLHAQDDPRVPFSSAPVTAAKWAQQNGCELAPRKVLEHGGTYCEAYTYCRQRTAVKLCAAETSGQLMAGAPAYSIDGTRGMWGFLRSH